MKLSAGRQKMDFADVFEIGEDAFAHGIERVLQRMTLMFGEDLNERLVHRMPQRAKFDLVVGVQPIRIEIYGENAVAFVLQRRVWVLFEILECSVAGS